jgi:protease IV
LDTRNNPPSEPGNGEGGAGGQSRRRRWPFVVGGLVALGLLVLTAGLVALVLVVGTSGSSVSSAAYYVEEYVSGGGPEKIAVVPVEGVIAPADSTVPGTQPTSTPEGLDDALQQAQGDGGVAAVVLEVNSPGGGVTASDEMHQSILDFREQTGKPVVVYMGDVATSGGYYISTAADRIVANETTLTGSLGVIMQLNNFTEIAQRYGYRQVVIKSGKFKDMGSSFRDLTPEEREILQSIVDESYDEFVQVIVEGRGLPEERVREIADGRVYSAKQAKGLGLVDSFGELDEAARVARELAGVEEATVVRYVQRPSFREALLARLAPQEPEALRIADEVGLTLEPKPYYLYLPGV